MCVDDLKVSGHDYHPSVYSSFTLIYVVLLISSLDVWLITRVYLARGNIAENHIPGHIQRPSIYVNIG